MDAKDYKKNYLSSLREYRNNRKPSDDEKLEILQLIEQMYGIDAETTKWIIASAFHDTFSITGDWEFNDAWKKDKIEENNELFEVRQVIQALKSGEIKSIDIQLKIAKSNNEKVKPVKITNYQNVSKILQYLESLPTGSPKQSERGRKQSFNKKSLISNAINDCSNSLKEYCNKSLNESEELFFTGLLLAYIGAIETPSKKDEAIQDYQKFVADQLRYYK